MNRLITMAGVATDTGQVRAINEDHWGLPPGDLPPDLLTRKGSLYIVADGMGGHQSGEVASAIAVQTITRTYYADPTDDESQALARAAQAANAEILDQAQDPALAGMGTTIVAAVVRDGALTVAHVGDSRAYLLRRGRLRRLTQDHTWVADQVRDGLLTPEQADHHVYRHHLSRAVGTRPDLNLEVGHSTLEPGDRLLLCSDGLWEQVSQRDVRDALEHLASQEAAQRLVELAHAAGGLDNATALVVALDRQGAAAPARSRPLWPLLGGLGVLLVALGAIAFALSGPAAPAPIPPTGPSVLMAAPTEPAGPTQAALGGELVISSPTPVGAVAQATDTPPPTAGPPVIETPGSPSPPGATAPPVAVVRPSVTREVTGNGVRIRQDPGTTHTPLGSLDYGAQVRIICKAKGEPVVGNDLWYYVDYSGGSGYISAYWVRPVDQATLDQVPLCKTPAPSTSVLGARLARAGERLCQ